MFVAMTRSNAAPSRRSVTMSSGRGRERTSGGAADAHRLGAGVHQSDGPGRAARLRRRLPGPAGRSSRGTRRRVSPCRCRCISLIRFSVGGESRDAPQVRHDAWIDVGGHDLAGRSSAREAERDERVHDRPRLIALRRAGLEERRSRRQVQAGTDDEHPPDAAVGLERLQDAEARSTRRSPPRRPCRC